MNIRALFFSAILLTGAQQVCLAGDTASETKKISSFTVLKIQGNYTIVLTQGSECSLRVSGDKSAIDKVQTKSGGITLTITEDQGVTGNVTLYITVKDVNQISIKGADKLSCTKEIKSDDLSLNLDDNVEGSLDLKLKMLTFNSNTDKNFTLTGKADKCNAKVEDDGAIDMSGFKVDDLTIDYSSDTDIKVFAHPTLTVKMSAGGNLTYYGNPKKKVFNVHGTGNPVEGK